MTARGFLQQHHRAGPWYDMSSMNYASVIAVHWEMLCGEALQ